MDQKWWALLAVSAGTFMLLLDGTIVTVALPVVQSSLHASFGQLQWVVGSYALTLAALLLTAGVLADRYGRKRLFAAGLVVFTVGSLTCGLAQSPMMLIVSRCAQGVGSAAILATSLALLSHAFRAKDRGVAFGVWGALTGVAASLGPVLGGAITGVITWRAIFLVNVPIGVAATILTIWRVEESRVADPRGADVLGFALLTGGLVSLVYGLTRVGETAFTDKGVFTFLGMGGVLLATFFLIERRTRHPMLDLALFRNRTFVGGLAAAFTINVSIFALFLYIVLYLEEILGYSVLATGLRLIVSTGSYFVAATLSGPLSERVPVRYLVASGLAVIAGGLWLMTGLSATSSWAHLLPGLVIAGLGAGIVNPPLASTAVGVVGPDRAGMASGVSSTFREVGFAIGVAALGSVLAISLQQHLETQLASVPALSGHVSNTLSLVRHGSPRSAIEAVAPRLRGELSGAIRSSFVRGLNELLLITGALALASALGALVLIRKEDFLPREATTT